MNKIYQPGIIELAEIYISTLNEDGFFEEFDLESTDYAMTVFCDKLTDKFIDGKDLSEDIAFNQEEMEAILKLIIAGTILYEMKDKGLVNSYEDDDTEEVFFLTEEGKQVLKNKK